MKLAVYQATSPAGDVSAGLATVEYALGQAAEAGASMLVMPELFLPGYNTDPPADWDMEATLDAVRTLVRASGVALTIGLADGGRDGMPARNLAIALAPDGRDLARYAKIQPFGPRERRLYAPGSELIAFDWRGRRFGLLICYDVEFPEHVRALALAGCDTILVPTANMHPFSSVNLMLVPARALENAITIAYANYCGAEGDLIYCGRSLIAGPDGPPLACMGEKPGLIVADIDTLSLDGTTLSTQRADLRRSDRVLVNGAAQ